MRVLRVAAARRRQLLIGASMATLALTIPATVARAQTLSGILAARQTAVRAPTAAGPGAAPVRPASMVAALSRQRAVQSQAADIRAFVTAARAAARPEVPNGLQTGGLVPVEAVRLAAAAASTNPAEAQRLMVSVAAANDPTGNATWQGAGIPVQDAPTTGEDAGRTRVTINQTESRAFLTWQSFNVGSNTTVQFNQKDAAGTAQPGWVAVNRVADAVAPSQILGRVRADGTVAVINRAGVVFGAQSQVNLRSLLVSTLELGNTLATANNNGTPGFNAASQKDRVSAYLSSGLLLPGGTLTSTNRPLLVSAQATDQFTANVGAVQFVPTLEGAITVDAGAQLTASGGGYLILAAPTISNAGRLTASDGQVSLQAGRAVAYTTSSGSANSVDPNVRGLILETYVPGLDEQQPPLPRPARPDDGVIVNTGLIESRRGYLSLGTTLFGSVTHSGLLSASTSVSANGKIAISAGNVVLSGDADPSRASGIELVPDNDGRTIPQGTPDQPSGFKGSELTIGAPLGRTLLPFDFAMGRNALIYAPGATVSIGREAADRASVVDQRATRIDIAAGATIDVSGLKDVALDMGRNSLAITPVKRNELRDTPNYREVAVDGNFTLNGATLYVDPRKSGVRADGVAWIGSPLIEAGSIASQIGSTVQEFMTRGGTVNLATGVVTGDVGAATAPRVSVAQGARIDFSGGWVSYAGGAVRTSALLTADGRVVDIAAADPNDSFVAVVDGYTAVQPRFGVTRTFGNAVSQAGVRFEAGYDEGRDAGALAIAAPAVTLEGSLFGQAFAGTRQVTQGVRPSLASTFTQDPRRFQRANTDLPASGFLRVGSFVGETQIGLGANLYVLGAGGSAPAADNSTFVTTIRDSLINDAGLSALTLQTSGSIGLLAGSSLTLAPGGAVRLDSGRSITLAGDITAPSGSIAARTYEARQSVSRPFGSPFTASDNLPGSYAADTPPPASPFDLTVTGRLSTAGLWVNDFTAPGLLAGGAFADGGSISLAVAPSVFVPVIATDENGVVIPDYNRAFDLSGNLRVGGTLDVSSGGYVDSTGALDLTARGGDISLLNETVYASLSASTDPRPGEPGVGQSIDIEPAADQTVTRVADPRSVVDFSAATLIGFGFGGGGTFSLTAPNVSFGSDNPDGSAHIGFDFLENTGFSELSVLSYKSRIVADLFANARANNSAFLDTTRFEIRAGETFDLTQWVLPSILTQDQALFLRQLGTGARLLDQPLIRPVLPASAFDRRAATLTLSGLIELDVLQGGTLTGAPGAQVNVGGLYNAGRIELRGGTITQRAQFASSLFRTLQVNDPAFGGNGLADVFGPPVDAQGRFDERAPNAAGLFLGNRLLTNAELVSLEGSDRQIYFGGRLASGQGVYLAPGSTTDLSGTVLTDPRATVRGDGLQLRAGRVLNGGSLNLLADQGFLNGGAPIFTTPTYESPYYSSSSGTLVVLNGAVVGRALVAALGSVLDVSGSSAVFDLRVTGSALDPASRYVDDLQWSRGGTVSALAGGTLAGATVRAGGGAAQAEGGTLEWLNPFITDDDRGGTLNRLTPAMISGNGFDSLVARGGLRLDGAVSLTLDKALLVTSGTPRSGDAVGVDAQFTIGATAGTVASIDAPYIRFASRVAVVPGLGPVDNAGDAVVRFGGARLGIDLVGGIQFDRSIASLTLSGPGDVRFIGIDTARATDPTAQRTLNGTLLAGGDLTIDAGRVYATTGTGNLQRVLENRASGAIPYQLIAAGDSTITFGNSFLNPNAPPPLSAGSYLQVLAKNIVQNGYLAAPLGLIEFGSATGGFNSYEATESIRFGAGSITRVSGAGLAIPYGITTDGVEYFFTPTVSVPLQRLPSGAITMTAGDIDIGSGATVDGRGGGDVFAYEFQSGVGGSRDVLDRFNRDRFSSNNYSEALGYGFQFPDARQVFAAVPLGTGAPALSPYDPIYSADYGAAGPVDLYGLQVGTIVTLDGVEGGPAQRYQLLPAHYALAIPGALRIVENTGSSAPVPGLRETLLDGSTIVGGYFGGVAGSDSLRRSFTLQGAATFGRYSRIITTSGNAAIGSQYEAGQPRPRLPLDSARVILAPLNALRIAGTFNTAPVSGGFGAQVDIGGANILISNDPLAEAAAGGVVLSQQTIASLNANSLLIGGRRTDNADGTTTVQVSANTLTVGSGVSLVAPELLLAVAGAQSSLIVDDGASLVASGTLNASGQTGDYIISRTEATGFDSTGTGSVLRLASGAERLIARAGPATGPSVSQPTEIRIRNATLTGNALALDSTRVILVAPGANIAAPNIAFSADDILFRDPEQRNTALGPTIEARLAAAEHVTLRSRNAIRFSAGVHSFRDLLIDAPALAFIAYSDPNAAIQINARAVTLSNSGNLVDTCVGVNAACGAGATLRLNTDTLTFGVNNVRTYGITEDVTLAAANGMFVGGKGSFTTGATDLTLLTPFLVERSAVADPQDQAVRPDYAFLTTGDLTIDGQGRTATAPTAGLAPGARIAFGTTDRGVASARIANTVVRATSGVIDLQSETGISIANATLAAPGYTATFGDAVDRVTVSAGAGTLNLVALTGDLTIGDGSTLITDNGVGAAGTLNLIAPRGTITLGLDPDNDPATAPTVAINPGVTGPRGGSLFFDSGTGGFALGAFAQYLGTRFQGDLSIRSGSGDLVLGAGQVLRASKVTLTADRAATATTGGAIVIGGTIDTSGVSPAGLSGEALRNARVNGGDIALWGMAGVTLTGGALLDTHTNGYADSDTRPASAGDVTIGIGRTDAAITLAPGARIDAGARRTQAANAVGETGARLLPEVITDPLTLTKSTVYRYVEADSGGTVHFRAPVIGAGGDQVALSVGGTIAGAAETQVEGFRTYRLDQLAQNIDISGVSSSFGSVFLDFAQDTTTGFLQNPFTEEFVLADGTPSMVNFVRNFRLTTQDGSSLDGYRLRPGVELTNPGGDVISFSAWNLAAATFDQAALDRAVADGDLVPNPTLGDVYTVGLQYTVVPGREAHLLENAANFLYRVGGRASGEAPVVTIKAAGTLDIDRSISDGFFTFRDKSDANYINYQLGGGNRTFSPAVLFACGSANDCSTVLTLDQVAQLPPTTTEAERRAMTVLISLSNPAAAGTQTSARFTNSPLAISGNGAAAIGTNFDSGFNPSGDPLGFAELFPRLTDGSAMRSSDIRLVGGTGPTESANPLRVDRATRADLLITGENSYRVDAIKGFGTYSGPLELRFRGGPVDPVTLRPLTFGVDETFNLPGDLGFGLSELAPDLYTNLNWGVFTELATDARDFAMQYFAGREVTYTGRAGAETGVVASLGDLVGFLQAFEPTYLQGIQDRRYNAAEPNLPNPIRFGSPESALQAGTAYVKTYVRTGDGRIDVAAARDVGVIGSFAPEYRRENLTLASGANASTAQFGSAAIYTAGVRASAAPLSARVVGGEIREFTLDSPYLVNAPERLDFIPSPKAFSDTTPVLAMNGGAITVEAGRDVVARRDLWSEQFLDTGVFAGVQIGALPNAGATAGTSVNRWYVGDVGIDTEIGISPRYFSSGIGALAGGDVSIRSGRDITDLTVALNSGISTAATDFGSTAVTLGSGDLAMLALRDMNAPRIDVATGSGTVTAGRDFAGYGLQPDRGGPRGSVQLAGEEALAYTRVRVSNARVRLTAGGAANIGSISALGAVAGNGTGDVVPQPVNALSLFSDLAAVSVTGNERTRLFNNQFIEQAGPDQTDSIAILPPTLELVSTGGAVQTDLRSEFYLQILYPSAIGQLNILSRESISGLRIAMSDQEPTLFGGLFVPLDNPLRPSLPVVQPDTDENALRLQHSDTILHAGDAQPIRIYTGRDLIDSQLFAAKQARVSADGDIVNLMFQGQNVGSSDITRIRAGGDITSTSGTTITNLTYYAGNLITLGGPGRLIVEAGGDIGPFATSATSQANRATSVLDYAGGITTVGNEYNPYLGEQGADIDLRFGMAGGGDYTALRETYLNPANTAMLDGDLFVQATDGFGNAVPDRARPVYAPILAGWLEAEAPEAFARIFGRSFAADTAGRAALAEASYGQQPALYAAFAGLDTFQQQSFLIKQLFFNELAQTAVPNGPSFNQFIRGYRAVQSLFPTARGYTDNYAPYDFDPSTPAFDVDPATVSADNPLGVPTRRIAGGQPLPATRVLTGNVDLRLAAVETRRGGDITILGPGGDLIAGSVVRTSEQAARRATSLPDLLRGRGYNPSGAQAFTAVPQGFEGVITLRGGQVRSFTDGSLLLNQSRLFTVSGGNITAWSSNADLNAGQGPKSAGTFPPITVRFSPDGLSEVNSAGSITGAGVGAFKPTPEAPASDVLLIAPVGEVDAGDAGVRASGRVLVAAARVANADNFQAAGGISGVPTGALTAAPATPAAASAIAAQVARLADPTGARRDPRTLISVDVLGPTVDCDDPANRTDPSCTGPAGAN